MRKVTTSLILLFSILLSVSGCDFFTGASDVAYKVTGPPGGVSITYANEDGGTSQVDAGKSWNYRFKAEPDQFLYVSAQNQDVDGAVTVQIFVDGEEFKRSSSTAAFGIATASGSAP